MFVAATCSLTRLLASSGSLTISLALDSLRILLLSCTTAIALAPALELRLRLRPILVRSGAAGSRLWLDLKIRFHDLTPLGRSEVTAQLIRRLSNEWRARELAAPRWRVERIVAWIASVIGFQLLTLSKVVSVRSSALVKLLAFRGVDLLESQLGVFSLREFIQRDGHVETSPIGEFAAPCGILVRWPVA